MHTHSVIRQFGNTETSPSSNSVIRQFGNSVISKARQGFTLVELLVVICIIGILSGIALVSVSGGTESARAALCLTNLRNLAAACQTYGSNTHRYPFAGSIEYMGIDESEGMARAKSFYDEIPGWISWASMGAYKTSPKPSSHQASSAWMTSAYAEDLKKNTYCMTNGALWKLVSGNHATFRCPSHVKKHSKKPPQWSYVMNAYFGWDTSKGSEPQGINYSHIRYGDLDRADRYLLFAELQFEQFGLPVPSGEGSGTDCDCVLQYDISGARSGHKDGANGSEGSGNELIGVNHRSGNELTAHVAFADGHVEKLRIPYSGDKKKPKVDAGQLRSLTTWLCTGEDVSFDGKRWSRMDN